MSGKRTSPSALQHRLITGPNWILLEDALQQEFHAIRKSAERDLEEIWLVVPSNLLKLHIRRKLASDGGHLNLRIFTLHELAHRFAATQPEYAKIASPFLEKYALRMLLLRNKPAIAGISDSSAGWEKALLSTLIDLNEAQVSSREHDLLGTRNPVVRNVLRLHSDYLDFLKEHQLLPFADVWNLAVNESRSSATPVILWHGFYDFNFAQLQLVKTLISRSRCLFFVPHAEDSDYEFSRYLVEWLKEVGFEHHRLPDPSQTLPAFVFSAPSEVREWETGWQWLMEESYKENNLLYDCAVLGPPHSQHARLGCDFDEARRESNNHIPGIFVIRAKKGSEHPAARRLLAFLEMIISDFRRDLVIAWLEIMGEESHGAWDQLSRQLGITRSWNRWESALKAQELNAQDDDHQIKSAYRRRLSKELLQQIEPAARLSRELQNASSFTDLLQKLIPVFNLVSSNPEELVNLQESLFPLKDLDRFGSPPNLASLHQLISELLESFTSYGQFQRNGPTVGSWSDSRGLTFRKLVLLGCSEDNLRVVNRMDPFLPDEVRRHFNEKCGQRRFDLRARRSQEERLILKLVRECAREAVAFGYTRVDSNNGRKRLPANFISGRIEDLRVGLMDMQPSIFCEGWQWDLGNLGAKPAWPCPNRQNYWLQLHSGVFSGLKAHHTRWKTRFLSEYDGKFFNPKAVEALKNKLDPSTKSFSASSWERFVRDPFEFFLIDLLGAQEWERPEDVLELSNPHRGTLYHAAFKAVAEQWKNLSLWPLKECHLRHYSETIEQECHKLFDEFSARVPVGARLLWDLQKEEVCHDLKEWVQRCLSDPSAAVPQEFEVVFEGEEFQWEGLRWRGRIDRWDRNQDETLIITDYKTGRCRKADLKHGHGLQMMLYCEVMQPFFKAKFGTRDAPLTIHGVYEYATSLGKFRTERLDAEKREALRPRMMELLDLFRDAIQNGIFPPLGNAGVAFTERGLNKLLQLKSGDPFLARLLDTPENEEESDE